MYLCIETEIMTPHTIELLAPARDAATAIEAIKHGADAVYIGAESHGARQAAANTVADIARVTDYAHRFNARVYVTLNTIVYDSELSDVERLVKELYRAGTDALIVQDMALLRLDIPPIALHASTQCDIRTPEKALFLARAGFSQLVVPRELTLEETRAIADSVKGLASIEAFVHGALCVSYSGDCQAGQATLGRSANRGCCPQICRHSFDLTDESGRVLIADKHLLSLRDLNRSALVGAMMDAGVSSFKIEGRLKDAAYVKNAVAAYREIIDRVISEAPAGKYRRASDGISAISFTPDLAEGFNRGYTEYFSTVARPTVKMASIDSPKWTGVPVGKVISSKGRTVKASLTTPLHNGDGLGYFDSERRFKGFRVNRVEVNTLFCATDTDVPAGTVLLRNHNHERETLLESETATRTIAVDMTLRTVSFGLALDVTDETGISASASAALELQEARKPQAEARLQALRKTGDTVFRAKTVTDLAEKYFIPLSVITDLRRRALKTPERARTASRTIEYRLHQATDLSLPETLKTLTYHDNVANRLAEEFYRDCGATAIEPALETGRTTNKGDLRVMTTRYCLRRECGHCLRTPRGAQWPANLFLKSGAMTFRLGFDCANCRMTLTLEKKD